MLVVLYSSCRSEEAYASGIVKQLKTTVYATRLKIKQTHYIFRVRNSIFFPLRSCPSHCYSHCSANPHQCDNNAIEVTED